jgi:hypothetical protein
MATDPALPPGGDSQRMVDQKNVKSGTLHLFDRQRGTVQRHRTLGRDEFRQFARGL